MDAFSFYYRNKIERDYFVLDFQKLNDENSWSLKKEFHDYELKIPEDQVQNKMRLKVQNKEKFIELIEAQYHFFGFEKSIYEYEKFDSYTELQLAEYADYILKEVTKENKPFWIRNERNIYFTYGSKKYYPDFILFKDEMIYVIETKGEIFSDTKKNALLKQLNESPGDSIIKGYKGLLIFEAQMEKMGKSYLSWDSFIKESEETMKRQQSKEQLVSDPKEEEKYIKCIPAYSPDNAYRKFIKGLKTAKPDGWLLLENNIQKLPETIFTTQAKGLALLPSYSDNSWVKLRHTKDIGEAVGKIALVYSENITDVYKGSCTIRKVEVVEKNVKGKLFAEKEVHLVALNPSVETIKIENVISNDAIEIIGLEYELPEN